MSVARGRLVRVFVASVVVAGVSWTARAAGPGETSSGERPAESPASPKRPSEPAPGASGQGTAIGGTRGVGLLGSLGGLGARGGGPHGVVALGAIELPEGQAKERFSAGMRQWLASAERCVRDVSLESVGVSGARAFVFDVASTGEVTEVNEVSVASDAPPWLPCVLARSREVRFEAATGVTSARVTQWLRVELPMLGGLVGGTALGAGGLGTRGSGSGSGDRPLGGRGTRFVPGKTTVVGGLTSDEVGRIVRRHWNEVKYCFEKELSRRPDLGGKVVVAFQLDGKGDVSSARIAESELKDEAVETCIVGNVKRWHFPAPRGGGVVDVNYPFIFKNAAE